MNLTFITWKRQLLENAATLFEPTDKHADADAERICPT